MLRPISYFGPFRILDIQHFSLVSEIDPLLPPIAGNSGDDGG